MDKRTSSNAANYKKKSSTIEKRTLRVHRRSLDWKQQRSDEVNRRRNCDEMSPVLEEMESPQNSVADRNDADHTDDNSTPSRRRVTRSRTPRSQKKSTNKNSSARLQQLKRWQEERLLKKKLESEQKKPVFKVGKVDHKNLSSAVSKTAGQAQKKTRKVPASQLATVPPVCKMEPAAGVSSQRVTRSAASRTAAQSTAPAMRSKAPAPKATPAASQRLARTTLQSQAEKQPPSAIEARTTRSKTSKASAKETKQLTKGGEAAAKKTTVFQFNAQTVSTRSREFTSEFSFTTPANLSTFTFSPLSPSSVAKFLGSSSLIQSPVPRRCSTPKFPGLHSGMEKLPRTPVDKNSDDKLKEIVSTVIDGDSDVKGVESGSDAFKSRSNVRRSIRLQQAEKLDVVSEEQSGANDHAGSDSRADHWMNNDDGREASLPITSQGDNEVQSAVSTDQQSKNKIDTTEVESDGQQEVSAEEKVENAGEDCGNDEVVQDKQAAVIDTATGTISDQHFMTEQTHAHAVENLKMSEQRQRRRSTRRSLRLASAEDTQSLSASDGKDSDTVIQPKDTDEPVALTSTPPSEKDNDNIINVQEDTELRNDSATSGPTTPVSTSRRKSRVRRSLAKTIVSPKAEDTVVTETTQEETAVTDITDEEADGTEITQETRKEETAVKKTAHEEADVAETTKEDTAQPESSTSELANEGQQENEDVSNRPETMVTPRPVTRHLRKSTSCVEEFLYPSPELTARLSAKKYARKKRSMSARRADTKTERSPEEWIKILETSPMIEMRRRYHKKKSPENRPLPINFDDIDSLICAGPVATSEEQEEESSPYDSLIQLQGNNQATSFAGDCSSEETQDSSDHNKENDAPVTMATTITSKETLTGVSGPHTDVKLVSDLPQEKSDDKEHDVKYFRDLLDTERCRLNGLCATWEAHNESEVGLSEDVKGQIRTTVGQAQLLMDQRFKQFLGLVDNCEFKTGEKETTCSDLQGFWDMVYFQVEDVDKKFSELDKLKNRNWVKEETVIPTKLKSKKKIVAKPSQKPVGKSKFAAFRAQMKKKNQGEDNSDTSDTKPAVKVFDAGFFKVSSPQKTPAPHCAGGTPSKTESKPAHVHFAPEETKSSPSPGIPHFSLTCPTTPVPPVIYQTPRRRSYVPAVPSPLLCDITPSGAKKRRSYRNTPVPLKLLKRHAESTGRSDDEDHDGDASPVKTRRRSRSSGKKTSLSAAPERFTPGESDLTNVLMYTQPLGLIDKQENSSEKKPKSALKKSRRSQSGTRRSARLSVHFDASFKEQRNSEKNMPQTPVNRNSRVAQTRVRSNSFSMSSWDDEETDLFKDSPRDSTDKENVLPPISPFTKDSSSPVSPKATNKRRSRSVVEADLISFSPISL